MRLRKKSRAEIGQPDERLVPNILSDEFRIDPAVGLTLPPNACQTIVGIRFVVVGAGTPALSSAFATGLGDGGNAALISGTLFSKRGSPFANPGSLFLGPAVPLLTPADKFSPPTRDKLIPAVQLSLSAIPLLVPALHPATPAGHFSISARAFPNRAG